LKVGARSGKVEMAVLKKGFLGEEWVGTNTRHGKVALWEGKK